MSYPNAIKTGTTSITKILCLGDTPMLVKPAYANAPETPAAPESEKAKLFPKSFVFNYKFLDMTNLSNSLLHKIQFSRKLKILQFIIGADNKPFNC